MAKITVKNILKTQAVNLVVINMKVLERFLFVGLLVFFSGISAANAESYIGLNLGQSSLDGYKDANSGFVYYGYGQQYWAVEAGVNPLGYHRMNGLDATLQIDGFEVDALAKYPVNQYFSAYAAAGFYGYTLKPELAGVKQTEKDGNTLKFGIGILLDLGQTLKARVAYEVYNDVEGLDANRLVFGLAAKIF